MRSLKGRLVVAALGSTVVALAAMGVLISVVLREFVETTFDSRLGATMVAVMAGVEYDDAGALSLAREAGEPSFSLALSGWYWQVDGGDQRLRSRSLWDQALAVDALASAQPAAVSASGPQGQRLRALVRGFTAPGEGGPLRIVVAGPAAEIDDALGAILRPLGLSLALLGAGLAIAIWAQVRIGLEPLLRLRSDLERVRRGETDRIEAPPIAELGPIATETNALIAHNAEVIARARTHVGNLAHALQTPLAAMAHQLSRAPASASGGDLARGIAQMQVLISHHLRRARAAASAGLIGTRAPVAAVVEDIADALRHIHHARDLSIASAVPADAVFAGEQQDLEEMLGNLMDNACKWARTRVAVGVTREGARLRLDIDDDGPGLGAGEREAALQRGQRLDEAVPGAGLGLAIAADLARLYGGGLELAVAPAGGLRARLMLPAAAT